MARGKGNEEISQVKWEGRREGGSMGGGGRSRVWKGVGPNMKRREKRRRGDRVRGVWEER